MRFLQQGPMIDFFSQRPFIEHLLHTGHCTRPFMCINSGSLILKEILEGRHKIPASLGWK